MISNVKIFKYRLVITGLLFWLLITIKSNAQVLNLHRMPESVIFSSSSFEHSAIKPYLINPGRFFQKKDIPIVMKEYTGRLFYNKHFKAVLKPVAAMNTGWSFKENPSLVTSTGLDFYVAYKNKLGFNLKISYDHAKYFNYLHSFTDTMGIFPGSKLMNNRKNNFFSAYNHSFYLDYNISEYFNLETGFGKNFLGDGYRSLLLSSNAYNYPYLKLITEFWHIKYLNLWMQLKDIRGSNSVNWQDHDTKWAALHYLSWNVTKKLNIGIFEAVVWQNKYSIYKRGFEINYLNPVIFYRPMEYAVGSPDNALIGLQVSYMLTYNSKIYGQFILDEFKLDEIIDQNGWWGNKQGVQLGLKSKDVLDMPKLDFMLEINAVRPFTYSHRQSLQSFGHYNQPLAHPLGANFVEGLFILEFQKERWYFQLKNIWAKYGKDNNGKSYGKNIFLSYEARAHEYGNSIAQGVKTNLNFHGFRTSFMLNSLLNLRAFGEITWRNEHSENKRNNDLMFSVGITSSIFDHYKDF